MQIKFEDGAVRARNRLAGRLARTDTRRPPLPTPSAQRPRFRKKKPTSSYSILDRRAPIDPADDGFLLAIFLMVVVFTLAVGYTLLRHEHIAELTGLENLRPK